jgi:LPXTG-site transpeptidase (sortase) family protein
MFNRLKQHWIVALGLVLAVYGISDASHILYQTWAVNYNQSLGEERSQLSLSGEIPQINLIHNPTPQLSPTPIIEATLSPTVLNLPTTQNALPVRNDQQESPRPITPSVKLASLPLKPKIPTRIVIPSIGLDAPIEPAETQYVTYSGISYKQWLAPQKYAVGWHADSAYLGELGNTVLNGHHNISGRVFGHLIDTDIGDLIEVYSGKSRFIYQITNKMILPEKYQKIDIRMDNAQWIMPSQDERLTIITCWPFKVNTHRLIIVARPISDHLLPDTIK